MAGLVSNSVRPSDSAVDTFPPKYKGESFHYPVLRHAARLISSESFKVDYLVSSLVIISEVPWFLVCHCPLNKIPCFDYIEVNTGFVIGL